MSVRRWRQAGDSPAGMEYVTTAVAEAMIDASANNAHNATLAGMAYLWADVMRSVFAIGLFPLGSGRSIV